MSWARITQSLTGLFLLCANCAFAQTPTPGNLLGPFVQGSTLTAAQLNAMQPSISPVSYGADPTGVADSAPALNAALSVSSNIVFPPGKFTFQTPISYAIPVGAAGLRIAGAGPGATILYWPNANGGVSVSYGGIQNNGSIFQDFTCATGQPGGGNCISLQAAAYANGAVFTPSLISNVTCRGNDGLGMADYWSICVNVAGISNVSYRGLYVQGPTGIAGVGVSLAGVGTNYSVVHNFSDSVFNTLSTGIYYGSYVQGVTVVGSNFTDDIDGILAPTGNAGFNGQLLVSNSQFGTYANQTGINIGIGTTYLDNIGISNNLFVLSAITAGGVGLFSYGRATITGNNAICPGGGNPFVFGSMPLDANAAAVATGNVIYNCSSGFILDAGSKGVTIGYNSMVNVGTAISNSSTDTNNIIADNRGYNPVVTGGSTAMGASPFTFTAGPVAETDYINQSANNPATCTRNGIEVAAITDPAVFYVIELGPNDSWTCTWTTTAPTYVRDIH